MTDCAVKMHLQINTVLNRVVLRIEYVRQLSIMDLVDASREGLHLTNKVFFYYYFGMLLTIVQINGRLNGLQFRR